MSFEIKIVDFSGAHEKSIRFIRQTVFFGEQSVDPSIDFDNQDQFANHALAYVKGKVCATGRILDDGHIGRIAVLKKFRGQGIGAKITESLVDQAIRKGYPRVYLGSQKHAIGFYHKLGFSPYGSEYIEANIEHMHMEKLL